MQLAHTASSLQPPPVRDDLLDELPTGRGFTALLAAFRATGGTARGDDVARLLEDHGLGNFIGLARLIANGDVFGFDWRGVLWIPMFQFELRDLSVKPATHHVLAELGSGFDGWSCATWFARPNSLLNFRIPVDLLATDLADVLQAARTDRFIAVG
ncbi:MAG: hypothetical protein ABI671_12830 [Burkholderiales bacterium]